MKDQYDIELISRAKLATERSYCPQSGFAVGACLLVQMPDGTLQYISGINYETQNYQSVCAERHAMQTATLECPREGIFLRIAVYSPHSPVPITPCGTCRQAIFERNPDMTVVSVSNTDEIKYFVARELLPHAFELK